VCNISRVIIIIRVWVGASVSCIYVSATKARLIRDLFRRLRINHRRRRICHTRDRLCCALTVQVCMLQREILWIVLKAPCVGRAHWLVYIDCEYGRTSRTLCRRRTGEYNVFHGTLKVRCPWNFHLTNQNWRLTKVYTKKFTKLYTSVAQIVYVHCPGNFERKWLFL
jgi:hypothetical protein